MNDGVWYDLVYSPEDGGWYARRNSDDKTSPVYDTEAAVVAAVISGWIAWEKLK